MVKITLSPRLVTLPPRLSRVRVFRFVLLDRLSASGINFRNNQVRAFAFLVKRFRATSCAASAQA